MIEFQNAYETAQIQKWDRITRTMDQVRAAHEDGKYVVVAEGLAYCPYTDAAMGTVPYILKACDTRAEAEALVNEYFEAYIDPDAVDVYIYPKAKAVKQQAITDFEDIPF
jgi:hypothetical protein